MRLTALIFLTLASCKILTGGSSCTESLKKDLVENWKYDSIKDSYWGNPNFFTKLDTNYRSCLYGRDTAYISKLFGKHYSYTKITGGGGVMEYKNFTNNPSEPGAVFYFQFDPKLHCNMIAYILIDAGTPVQ